MNFVSKTLLLLAALPAVLVSGIARGAAPRPNIVFIMTDDMGFSDISPYGGEMDTPNLAKLAAGGVRFSQFYNCGKCEPTRAAILTGQQFWTKSPDVAVRKDSPNMGEVLRAAGYRNMMVGKWHNAGNPFERGFDRHFGFMGGGTDSFLGDESFTLDGKPWPVPKESFYSTTALTDYAVKFLREEHAAHADQPFFLYLAYNAPHASIEAPAEVVAKYRGKYLKGWDNVRKERFERQQSLGLAGPGWHLSDRPQNIPAWDSLSDKEKDFQDLRMATYAAMIDCVDQGVGAVLDTLDEMKVADNTLVIFMNDNGASPNDRVRSKAFGSPGSNWGTGVAWANVSNTPFRYYKRTQHNGGTTTPFIVRWSASVRPANEFLNAPCHVTDLLPTFIDLAGTSYPGTFGGKRHPPLPGRSIVPLLRGEQMPPRTLYFSLFNNMALIDGGWKIVTAYNQPWQLYDPANDRTEMHDLAVERPEKLQELLALQQSFEARPDVALRLQAGEREPEFAPVFKPDGSKGPGSREEVADPAASLSAAKARAKGQQLNATETKSPQQQPKGKRRRKTALQK